MVTGRVWGEFFYARTRLAGPPIEPRKKKRKKWRMRWSEAVRPWEGC